jgi:hypothetical protein
MIAYPVIFLEKLKLDNYLSENDLELMHNLLIEFNYTCNGSIEYTEGKKGLKYRGDKTLYLLKEQEKFQLCDWELAFDGWTHFELLFESKNKDIFLEMLKVLLVKERTIAEAKKQYMENIFALQKKCATK